MVRKKSTRRVRCLKCGVFGHKICGERTGSKDEAQTLTGSCEENVITLKQRCGVCRQRGHNTRTCTAKINGSECRMDSREEEKRKSSDVLNEDDEENELEDILIDNEPVEIRIEEQRDQIIDEQRDETPIMHEGPRNLHVCDSVNECCCCHRRSTETYSLELKTPPNEFVRRKYGDMNAIEDGQVCSCCYNYITEQTRGDGKWCYAWPSVLYSFLTRASIVSDATRLVELLPITIREMYNNVIDDMNPNISCLWNINSKFLDATPQINNFEANIKEHKLGKLSKALNEEINFPFAVCPMGCNLFPDDKRIRSLLPAHHYLSLITNSFSSFNSKSNFFDGSNPEWPYVEMQLKWKVGATLLITEDKGLCIVTCSKDVHCDGRSKYLHVPTNPIQGNLARQEPDGVAPASVVPHFVRSGRSNEMNSSSMVLKETGDACGASSFSLTARPLVNRTLSHEEIHSMGFTLDNRKDVHQSLVEAEGHSASVYNSMVKSYKSRAKVSEERITAAKETGTFVSKEDSIQILKNYEERHKTGESDNLTKIRKKGHEHIEIVHRADKVGQRPFPIANLSKEKGNHGDGIIIHSIIDALLHNRTLHLLFIEEMKNSSEDSIHFEVQNLLKSVSMGRNPPNGLGVEAKLKQEVLRRNLVDSNSRPSKYVAAILKVLCKAKTFSGERSWTSKRNFDSMRNQARQAEKVIVVDMSGNNLTDFQVPLKLLENKWELAYASQHKFDEKNRYEIVTNFRWSSDFKWQKCTGDQENSSFSENFERQNWNLLIYIDKQAMSTFNKEDYLNFSGGQTKLKCSLHSKNFFMKEQAGGNNKCCYEGCSTSIRWRCSHGFARVTGQCCAGLCIKHADRILKSDESGVISPPRYIPRNRGSANTTEHVNPSKLETVTATDERDYSIRGIIEDPREEMEELEDVADAYCIAETDGSAELPCSTRFIPDTSSLRNDDVSGHYLLNHHLCCFKRVTVNRKAPVKFQRLFQHLHSVGCDQSLPLLYPEGLLFPQIFWATVEDSIIGALPSFMFSEYGRRSTFGGFASLIDHLRVRLSNNKSLTSHQGSYIAFAFDVYLNSLLQSNSVAVALKKGLEHVNKAYVLPENREGCLKFDEIDSRKEVKRLSALMKDHPWNYFITLTCNDSATMGVYQIRKAIENKWKGKREEMERELQNYAAILCRAWERTVYYLFEYLLHSSEEILGKVVSYWYRFEFQSAGAQGNRPHVHGGLSLDPLHTNDAEDVSRIANRMIDVFSGRNKTDCKSLLADGIVKDPEEFYDLWSLGNRLLKHECKKSNMRCQKLQSDGTKKCRVPRHMDHNPAFFIERDDLYDEKTKERLLKLGLAEQYRISPRRHIRVHRKLRGCRFYYPTDPECVRSPTNARLFSVLRSVSNVQKCDFKFQTSYLAKYAAGADEKREVIISAHKKDSTVLEVDARDLHNSKISGAAFAEKNRQKSERAPEALAREISLNEMIWFTAGLPFVRTNIDFVNCSTYSPEYRQSVVRLREMNRAKIVDENGTARVISSRRELPEWRQFTANQRILIEERLNSKYFVDNTSAFSIRPPELLKINNLKDYIQWFAFCKAKQIEVSGTVDQAPWIDGRGKLVKVRKKYISNVTQRLMVQSRVNDDPGVVQMLQIFQNLSQQQNDSEHTAFFLRYVDVTSVRDVVVVPTPIDPKNFNKFLTHLLLTMGNFETELDLYSTPSLLHSFELAGLIRDANNPTVEEAHTIIRSWVMNELRVLPVGSKRFSRMLSIAMDHLVNYFRTKELEFDGVPLASLRAIQVQAEEKLFELERTRLETLASVVCAKNIPNTPSQDLVGSGSRFMFNPVLQQIDGQSEESHSEQSKALGVCVEAINSLCSMGISFVRLPIIVGPPGSGKTHLLITACLYALSKGLKTMLSAVTAERARMLGGEHLHLLFSLPYSESKLETVNIIAEKCLLQLLKNDIKFAFLKRLDVLIIEEIGLLPGYMLHVIDLVLRRVRDSTVPFGGLMILSNGDPKQLKPIDGRSIWLTPDMYTTFEVLCLKHLVRSRNDEDLQLIIQKMRKPTLNEEDANSIVDTLMQRSLPGQFVSDWSLVPDNYHRVVGKHAGVNHAVGVYLKQKKSDPELTTVVVKALDETESVANNWICAGSSVSKQLSRKVKEPFELMLYKKQIVRLTYNNSFGTRSVPKFSQGQLAVIIEIPDCNKPEEDQRVIVKLCPPGHRLVDYDAIPAEWPQFSISRRHTNPTTIGCKLTKARRFQFPVVYFVCSTIHKVIGETCPKLATQISACKDMFGLWDRNQLLVLISRVQSLDDIMFVGSPTETAKAIKELLFTREPLDEYTDKVISACDTLRRGCRIIPAMSSIPSLLTSIPSTDCGFVFMLVSTKYNDVYTIDEATCIYNALKQWNDVMYHPEVSHLRPWTVAMFACSFNTAGDEPTNSAFRRKYVRKWIDNINLLYQRKVTSKEAMYVGEGVFRMVTSCSNDSSLMLKMCCVLGRPVPLPSPPISDWESQRSIQPAEELQITRGPTISSVEQPAEQMSQKRNSAPNASCSVKSTETIAESQVVEVSSSVTPQEEDLCNRFEMSIQASENIDLPIRRGRKRKVTSTRDETTEFSSESDVADAGEVPQLRDTSPVIAPNLKRKKLTAIVEQQNESQQASDVGERLSTIGRNLVFTGSVQEVEQERDISVGDVSGAYSSRLMQSIVNSGSVNTPLGDDIKTVMDQLELQLVPTPADGHCLLHALSISWAKQIETRSAPNREFIKIAMNAEFAKNRGTYCIFMVTSGQIDNNEMWNDYMEHRKYDSPICDAAPLIAAAALNIVIIVIEEHANGTVFSIRIDPNWPTTMERSKRLVLAIHKKHDHFSALTPSGNMRNAVPN